MRSRDDFCRFVGASNPLPLWHLSSGACPNCLPDGLACFVCGSVYEGGVEILDTDFGGYRKIATVRMFVVSRSREHHLNDAFAHVGEYRVEPFPPPADPAYFWHVDWYPRDGIHLCHSTHERYLAKALKDWGKYYPGDIGMLWGHGVAA